ncbi:MAG TPA: type II toxin-antitoxin system HicA family toxin [Lacipirellulaceae bacterium]|nr:type II toxin-antitoxin system HicA family toxin [Lacipirellulaceae bacterium]
MKRKDLVKHLRQHGCRLLREGRGHSVWMNPINGEQSSIPRHREINEYTVRAICRQLGIAGP